jgi:hypothetical protein
MTKRWLLFLGLYLSCVGAIAFGLDLRSNLPSAFSNANSELTLQVLQVGVTDSLPDEARLGRSVATALPKQRVGDLPCNLEDCGLEFLACKIRRAYLEVYLEDYAIRLMGKTIQVNAP